jgi:ArsR family transcriptional regulator
MTDAIVAWALEIIRYLLYDRTMQENDIVRALAALAQEVRLRVFRALVVAGNDGLTPGVLADQLDVAPNTLSFHLKELMHAGLISQERQGRNLVCRASFSTMIEVLAYLTENCCQGADCLTAAPIACDC